MAEAKLHDVQSSYDQLAEEYARRIYDELRHKPTDRQLLDRFAESVRGSGMVCDLGCGPGQVARYLQNCGVPACGVDLSLGMIEQARRLNPAIEFSQGDMTALAVEDNSWAGIAAFYAIVNLAPDDVSRALREMWRVLQTSGRLLLSFHLGDDSSHVEENLWDLAVSLPIRFFRSTTVAGHMRTAGFEIEEIVERDPYAPDIEYQSRRAYIFARKPLDTTRS